MPGVDLSHLSSNWKKLQAQLQPAQKEKKPGQLDGINGVKRKRTAKDDLHTHQSKRSRIDRPRIYGRSEPRKMGSDTSQPKDKYPQSNDAHLSLQKNHDISSFDLDTAYGVADHNDTINVGRHPTTKAGKYLALDCEMVGTGPPPCTDDVLARVSIVNFHGEQVYDSYVLPPPGVIISDYRTHVSGIVEAHMVEGYARPFAEVQKEVFSLLDGKILVGHALRKDMQVLQLNHPLLDVRDTSRYEPYRVESKGKPPALKNLAKSHLDLTIQRGEHSSLEDARAAMMLYRKEKTGFENDVRRLLGSQKKRDTGAHRPRLSKANPSRAITRESVDDTELLAGERDSLVVSEEVENDVDYRRAPEVKKKSKKKKKTKR